MIANRTSPNPPMLAAVLLVSLTLAVGCKPAYQRETAPVRGTVTLNGKPLTGGGVMFLPASGRGAMGEIGPDGTYTLSTYGNNDGAAVGTHRVAVFPGSPANEEEEKAFRMSPMPRKYQAAETSGIEVDVKSDEENVIDLKLTS